MVFIYHAGGDGGFALGVADVEAFDAVELGGGQLQQFGQGLDALSLVLVLLLFLAQGEQGVLFGHLQPHAPLAAGFGNKADLFAVLFD